MIYDLNEIANLPDTFSLEDLRVVCHISKRTARYYLRAGLIPCEISEKKTHCYTILSCLKWNRLFFGLIWTVCPMTI